VEENKENEMQGSVYHTHQCKQVPEAMTTSIVILTDRQTDRRAWLFVVADDCSLECRVRLVPRRRH